MESPPPPDIFAENPYSDHPSLSTIEKDVLWEYAKLAENLKQIKQKALDLTELPDTLLVARLRTVENKMGLILTLFKASVWGVINEQNVTDPSTNSDLTNNTLR